MYLLPLLYCIGHVSDDNGMIATWTASNYKLSSLHTYKIYNPFCSWVPSNSEPFLV